MTHFVPVHTLRLPCLECWGQALPDAHSAAGRALKPPGACYGEGVKVTLLDKKERRHEASQEKWEYYSLFLSSFELTVGAAVGHSDPAGKRCASRLFEWVQ